MCSTTRSPEDKYAVPWLLPDWMFADDKLGTTIDELEPITYVMLAPVWEIDGFWVAKRPVSEP